MSRMQEPMTGATVSDWDEYYTRFRVPDFMVNALWRHFEAVIRANVRAQGRRLVVVELGGADSCMYDRFARAFPVEAYHVVDNNHLGLERFRARAHGRTFVHELDLLAAPPPMELAADVVFSVGVVEHFVAADTRRLIDVHFDIARPGGLVVMSFPTPTGMYWTYRRFLEIIGKFPPLYERPLRWEEVEPSLTQRGTPLDTHLIRATILTQLITAVRRDH